MITEDDVKQASSEEKLLIDSMIDHGPQRAGHCERELVHTLYWYVVDYILRKALPNNNYS